MRSLYENIGNVHQPYTVGGACTMGGTVLLDKAQRRRPSQEVGASRRDLGSTFPVQATMPAEPAGLGSDENSLSQGADKSRMRE